MGHERLGILPKTKRWQQIVELLAADASDDVPIRSIIEKTTENLKTQYLKLCTDRSVSEAIGFAILLGRSAKQYDSEYTIVEAGQYPFPNESTFQLTRRLSERLDPIDSFQDYKYITTSAFATSLQSFFEDRAKQTDLFFDESSRQHIWSQLSDGAGFCEFSRQFFANLTQNYFEYYLDRAANQEIHDLSGLERFKTRLKLQIDELSRHSFETSKITQSFAAGWFNAHARDRLPSKRRIQGFVRFAGSKLQESLLREAS